MDFDAGYLISNLLIGCAGMAYFMYGKKAGRPYPLIAGLLLCIYPWFVTNMLLMWGIAIAIMVAVYFLREQ